MKWINYMYTYIPSLLDLPFTHPHPTHLGGGIYIQYNITQPLKRKK